MKLYKFKRLIYVGFFITALVCSIFIAFIYQNSRATEKIASETKQLYLQLNRHQTLLINLQLIENGQRGYVITGDSKFLNTYDIGKQALMYDSFEIKQEVGLNLPSHSTYDSLRLLMKNKIAFSDKCIQTRNQQGQKAAEELILQSEGWQLMNQIREILHQLNNQLLNHIEESNKASKKLTERRFAIFSGLVVILAMIFIINFWIFRKGFRMQFEREKLLNYNNAIIENLIDPVITTDLNYHIISWNYLAEELFGFSFAEVKGKRLRVVLQTKSNHLTLEEIRDIIYDNGSWNGDLIYHKRNGEPIFMNVSTSLLKDEKDNPYGTVSILRDMSSHESTLFKTKSELESLNERMNLILQSTNEALWDWDIKNNIVWGNQKYYEMLGIKSDESDNFEEYVKRIHPEDLAANFIDLESAYQRQDELFVSEYRFLIRENQWINILNRQIIVYNKESGEPVRCLGSLMDVTELKKAQEKIINEKEISDSLINTLPGIFYMFNSDYQMMRWNQNILNITGYSNEEMSLMHPAAFVPEEQRGRVAEKIESVFINGYDNIEADMLTKEGKRIPYYFTGIKTLFDGKVCLVGVGIDISETVNSKEQLRLLAKHLQEIREEERSYMSREIHDELGQQLTGMKMNLSWLNKKIRPEDIEIKAKMQDSLTLLDATVKSMRRISSMLRPSMLDDLGLLATMEWQSEDFEKRYQIKSVLKCNKQQLTLSKDQSIAIFRIYQEGLTNVAKHSSANMVQTFIHIENDHLQMSISDNGIGINPVKNNGEQKLGLLGIQERVMMTGGSFEILSELQNGTTLLVKIPLVV